MVIISFSLKYDFTSYNNIWNNWLKSHRIPRFLKLIEQLNFSAERMKHVRYQLAGGW